MNEWMGERLFKAHNTQTYINTHTYTHTHKERKKQMKQSNKSSQVIEVGYNN